jgi:hypothetical protein
MEATEAAFIACLALYFLVSFYCAFLKWKLHVERERHKHEKACLRSQLDGLSKRLDKLGGICYIRRKEMSCGEVSTNRQSDMD